MKSERRLPWVCWARDSPDRDGPSDRNCTASFTLTHCHAARRNLLQHQPHCFGFVIQQESRFHPITPGAFKTMAAAVGQLSIYWVLLCKNCVAVLRRIPATDAVFSKDFANAHETCRRHNCRVCICKILREN